MFKTCNAIKGFCGFEQLQKISEPNTKRCNSKEAECHGHARPRRVAHGRMPMTSPTLYVFSYSSVYFCISKSVRHKMPSNVL